MCVREGICRDIQGVYSGVYVSRRVCVQGVCLGLCVQGVYLGVCVHGVCLKGCVQGVFLRLYVSRGCVQGIYTPQTRRHTPDSDAHLPCGQNE